MVIQNNIPGLNSKRIYNKNSSKLAKSLEKLSSGYSINRAADDSAGLAVSEKMRSQICGMKQSVKNCQDGISLIQTFEGALGETVAIIKRMKSLADQIANGTYDDNIDRNAVEIEYCSLKQEVDQIADTDFNGIVMLNGRRMADKFTFLTESGIKWLTPSNVEFPEESFISTFKKVEGFPDIKMSIDLLPDAKEKLVSDKELMLAFEKLNKASVKSFYDKGIPKFTLEGLKPEDMGKFSIETIDNTAIISAYTSQSGKVDIARVECTELPHYASTSARGKWVNSTVLRYQYAELSNIDPTNGNKINESFDLSKWEKGYVDSKDATKEERTAYVKWIKDTPNSKVNLIPDTEFDEDTDPIKFIWSLTGKEYENEVDENGVPKKDSGVTVPIYADDYKDGPQVFIKDLRFLYDDEDMNTKGSVGIIQGRYYNTASGDARPDIWLDSKRCYEIWLDNGQSKVTITYDKASDTWSDNFGGSGSTSDYGISTSTWWVSDSKEWIGIRDYYEADGKLPDKFTLNFTTSCPVYRSFDSTDYAYSQSAAHSDYSNGIKTDDFKLEELDPAYPDNGGVDYTVAEHGATYTYDGRKQDDGTVGIWRDKDGNAVELAEKGIYLPKKIDSTALNPLHDGMTITVSNPTMVGQDYIQAKIRLFDEDRGVNAYRRIYDNITYSDSLILQAGARTKDAVNFTFAYSSDGIGGLNADLDCTAKGLGLDMLTLAKQESANFAIDRLDYALNKVSMIRATFGAAQNRLEHKIDNLNNTTENLTAAESRIRDTDMAKEMMNFTKQQILTQSSQSMLAQANSLPQQVMSLLTG